MLLRNIWFPVLLFSFQNIFLRLIASWIEIKPRVKSIRYILKLFPTLWQVSIVSQNDELPILDHGGARGGGACGRAIGGHASLLPGPAPLRRISLLSTHGRTDFGSNNTESITRNTFLSGAESRSREKGKSPPNKHDTQQTFCQFRSCRNLYFPGCSSALRLQLQLHKKLILRGDEVFCSFFFLRPL